MTRVVIVLENNYVRFGVVGDFILWLFGVVLKNRAKRRLVCNHGTLTAFPYLIQIKLV